ncbi:hypothetical protein ES705_35186 [subsurface metagenome]|nr:hypothetical protein [Methanosarcinales archaeon]
MYECDEEVKESINRFSDYICEETLAESIEESSAKGEQVYDKKWKIGEKEVYLAIEKNSNLYI